MVTPVLLRAWRVPWQWLVPLVLALPTCLTDSRPEYWMVDLPYFTHAGETLLSSHWSSTFTDPTLQAGPLQVALFGAVGRIAALIGVHPSRLMAPLVELGIVALLVFVVGRVAPPARFRRLAQLTIATFVVLLGDQSTVYLFGHPADAVIPLLWLLAAHDARASRVARAGLLLALSANLEIWGLLGAPVLLLAPGWRETLRGAALQGVATAAPFLPFLVAAPFKMFDYQWRVSEPSFVALVLKPGSPFPWTLRLAQGAVALAAGAGVAHFARRSAVGVALVPLVIVTVRLLLDPLSPLAYYQIAFILLALVTTPFVASYAAARLHLPRMTNAEVPDTYQRTT